MQLYAAQRKCDIVYWTAVIHKPVERPYPAQCSECHQSPVDDEDDSIYRYSPQCPVPSLSGILTRFRLIAGIPAGVHLRPIEDGYYAERDAAAYGDDDSQRQICGWAASGGSSPRSVSVRNVPGLVLAAGCTESRSFRQFCSAFLAIHSSIFRKEGMSCRCRRIFP